MEEKSLVINSYMSTFDIISDIFYSGTHAFRGENDSILDIAFLRVNMFYLQEPESPYPAPSASSFVVK